MAEYTRMRNNVLGYPIYGLPYVIIFPILDEDGDPVTGLTPDSEISKNGNTAVDCHNEGVEIAFDTATNKGMYYLDLTGAHTGTETAADVVAVTIYTGAATSQATCIVLYPKKLPKVLSGTVGATGNDTTHVHIPDGVSINDFYNGCVLHMNESGNDECRMITDYVASTKLATLNLALDAAPTASTSTYDVYMTEVAIASILALMVGMVPNAVAGAANGLVIAGSNAATTFATLTSTGAFTAGSNAIPWNSNWDAEVQSEVQDAIEANNLDHLVKIAVGTNWATTVTKNSIIDYLTSKDSSQTFDRSTDSEEAIRDRGDSAWGASGVATLVWTAESRTLTTASGLLLSSKPIDVASFHAVQGATHDPQTITWYDPNGDLLDLSDVTGITAVIQPLNGDPAFASDGVFALVGDGSTGQFTWTYGEGDVENYGDFEVQFTAAYNGDGTVSRTLKIDWTVEQELVVPA